MTNDNDKPATVVDINSAKRASAKGGKCPMCAKPAVQAYQPFCSKRCADLDLGKWLGEGYRIPTDDAPGSDGNYDGED